MKLVLGFPPNFEKIKAKFPISLNTLFAFGDKLYSPLGNFPDTYLWTHEETHSRQQGTEVEKWWDKYIRFKKFRLTQETEAYHNQYEHYCRNKHDFGRQAVYLELIASQLSGELYGNLCTLEQAKNYIKSGKVE